jgi:hypothetical protein
MVLAYVQTPKHCRRRRVFIRGTRVGPIPVGFLDGEGGERHTRSLIDKELCFAVRGGIGDSSAIDALGGEIGRVLRLALLQNILISHLVSLLFKGIT